MDKEGPMSVEEGTNRIAALIKKASEASKSEDAMRFSQAAVNAANALRALNDALRALNDALRALNDTQS